MSDEVKRIDYLEGLIHRMLQSVTGPYDGTRMQTISMNLWVYGEALKAIGKTQQELTEETNKRFSEE